MKRFAFSVIVLCFMSACASAPKLKTDFLTEEEIMTYGTKKVALSYETAFRATELVMQRAGYRLATSDSKNGILITEVRDLGSYGIGKAVGTRYSANSAMATITRARLYEIRFKKDGNETVVVAVPRVFVNGADVSKGEVWLLDGPAGERFLWKGLFSEIETMAKSL